MQIKLAKSYNDIISVRNLLEAWIDFLKGKKDKVDVQYFATHLMDNIIALHLDLVNKTYQHGGYESFFINDPKRRHIHKASVRDRLLHHAVYRILYPFFDKTFIADSYSCRNEKGTHRAINRFRGLFYRVSKNNTRTCWVLKCDIRKFFASIDHDILFAILKEYIPDENILWLLKNIIESFETTRPLSDSLLCEGERGATLASTEERAGRGLVVSRVGLPLGNLTSQLFANIYLNKFDRWVKHTLKSHYYVRFADDFVFLSRDRFRLEAALLKIQTFLQNNLKLSLHPDKLFISTMASGVDFLGWVHFTNHRVLRGNTKDRMLRRMKEHPTAKTFQSYLGLLSHGNSHKILDRVADDYWLWRD